MNTFESFLIFIFSSFSLCLVPSLKKRLIVYYQSLITLEPFHPFFLLHRSSVFTGLVSYYLVIYFLIWSKDLNIDCETIDSRFGEPFVLMTKNPKILHKTSRNILFRDKISSVNQTSKDAPNTTSFRISHTHTLTLLSSGKTFTGLIYS